MTTGLHDLVKLLQDADVIIDVLDDIERDDTIETAITKWWIGDRALDKSFDTTLSRVTNGLGGTIETDRIAVRFETLQHLSGPAPGVEDTKWSIVL
jgi:hypothetical protein